MGLDSADVQELQVIMEMIDETRAKAKLLLKRMNEGEYVEEKEVENIEENTKIHLVKVMKYLQKEDQVKNESS